MPKVAHVPTRAEQAACIKLVMDFRGMKLKELARKAKISRNGIANHLNATLSRRRVVPYYLRKYEQALGLPDLILDRADRGEVLAFLQSGQQRVTVAQPDPFAAVSGSLEDAFRFVRSQLQGYRDSGRAVPVAVVVSWIAELEAACASEAAPTHGLALPGSGSAS